MKKLIVIAAAVLATFQLSLAQSVKEVEAAKNEVAKAKEATLNEKKATNVATWLKYGQTILKAYEVPAGQMMRGWDINQVNMLLTQNGVKKTSQENVTLMGQAYTKMVLPTANYYFNASGQLALIEKTVEVAPDALSEALAAFAKAYEVDAKAKKTEDIKKGISSINESYVSEASNAYYFGDYAKSSELFAKAYEAALTAPLSQVDTNSLYNAGLTAWFAGKMDVAKAKFIACRAIKYFATDGDVLVKLADIENKAGNKDESRVILEEAFERFPQSQGILIGLINHYTLEGGNTDRLFELIGKAKANEPNNPSLVYVEGQIYEKLGRFDEAVAAYDECAKVDPKYPYAYIGKALLYNKKADEIAEKAQNEMDNKKYDALVEQWKENLTKAFPEFEKAYQTAEDAALKKDIASFVKDIAFRLRNEGAEYQQKYEEYSKIVAGN